jgi:hypothetical protein
MPATLARLFNKKVVTGNWNTDAAGTDKNGARVSMGQVLLGTLTAYVTVDAETNTLTISGRWQVSNDDSTYVDIVESNNPANVVLATGTAGADAAVTKAICAPDQVYGYRYARYVCTSGVAVGATADTYSIGYSYVKRTAATDFA